jgi:hypothetical protein
MFEAVAVDIPNQAPRAAEAARSMHPVVRGFRECAVFPLGRWGFHSEVFVYNWDAPRYRRSVFPGSGFRRFKCRDDAGKPEGDARTVREIESLHPTKAADPVSGPERIEREPRRLAGTREGPRTVAQLSALDLLSWIFRKNAISRRLHGCMRGLRTCR